MSRYRYVVELRRRVADSGYGPQAYTTECTRKSFVFGKNEEFKTGAAAEQAAIGCASTMLDLCTSVSIWRMNGGSGLGTYLKNSDEVFATGLEVEGWK